jgi:hypothetical protein
MGRAAMRRKKLDNEIILLLRSEDQEATQRKNGRNKREVGAWGLARIRDEKEGKGGANASVSCLSWGGVSGRPCGECEWWFR